MPALLMAVIVASLAKTTTTRHSLEKPTSARRKEGSSCNIAYDVDGGGAAADETP
jgi:hypothetical protein